MKFLEFNIAKPPFDTVIAQRGLTYAAAVHCPPQMIIYDREPATQDGQNQRGLRRRSAPDRLRFYHRQQRWRVIVNKLHRSPGLRGTTKGKDPLVRQAAVQFSA